ncbi:MAG: YcjF family protein [Rubrobacteraceae bacterium]
MRATERAFVIGLRNLYNAFNESRKAAKTRATLAVTGGSPRAAELAGLLGAQRSARGAELLLTVSESGDSVTLSGKAVDKTDEISLPSSSGEKLISELAPRVVGALDEDYLVPLGFAYPAFRRAVCEEVIRKNARQNAVIGALPVPGADLPVMTANQARMVLNIAAIHGEELSLERARELIGVLAAGFGFRALGRQLVKLVPVGGWAAAGVIGYAGTLAMGRAAMLYFARGKRQPDEKEMSEIRSRATEEAKDFVSRMKRR